MSEYKKKEFPLGPSGAGIDADNPNLKSPLGSDRIEDAIKAPFDAVHHYFIEPIDEKVIQPIKKRTIEPVSEKLSETRDFVKDKYKGMKEVFSKDKNTPEPEPDTTYDWEHLFGLDRVPKEDREINR